MREKFSFLYPSEQISKVLGRFATIGVVIMVTSIGLYVIGATTWKLVFYKHADQEQSGNTGSVVDPQTGDIDIENLKEYLHTSGTDLMLSKVQGIPTYEDFLKDLEKICPYYKPDGVSYRECLYNLLAKKDERVNAISDDLVKDIQVVIAEKKTNPDEMNFDSAYFGEQHFLESFAELRKSWRPYRDGLCEADYATSFAGSNTSGFIMTCKLYETEKYLTKLVLYRYDWVAVMVQKYLDDNTQPRTEAFMALVEKERKLLDR